MKRLFLIITILGPFFAMAQEASDLYDFSSINYQGTAKAAAMGNAMGAVGSAPGLRCHFCVWLSAILSTSMR